MFGNVLTPLKVLTLDHFYDDLKFLLTGNVESSEFKEGKSDSLINRAEETICENTGSLSE